MANRERSSEEDKENFDSMAWLERVQGEIHDEIKDLTTEEELEYWRQAAERGPHREWWREAYRRAGIVRDGSPGRTAPQQRCSGNQEDAGPLGREGKVP